MERQRFSPEEMDKMMKDDMLKASFEAEKAQKEASAKPELKVVGKKKLEQPKEFEFDLGDSKEEIKTDEAGPQSYGVTEQQEFPQNTRFVELPESDENEAGEKAA